MRTIIFFAMLGYAYVSAGCGKTGNGDDAAPVYGYVSGIAKDRHGNVLKDVKVTMDHTIFYNSYVSTITGNDGKYRVKIPTGSWIAYAEHKVRYHGREYVFDLHPDNATGFGGEGAVRNFEWRLSGEKAPPLTGYYGGTITFDNLPGNFVEEETKIVFTLVPSGTLVDGSAGEVLTLRSTDGSQLPDIPVGEYTISAVYEGEALQLRRWGTEDAFVASLPVEFETAVAGACENCAKIEYKR